MTARATASAKCVDTDSSGDGRRLLPQDKYVISTPSEFRCIRNPGSFIFGTVTKIHFFPLPVNTECNFKDSGRSTDRIAPTSLPHSHERTRSDPATPHTPGTASSFHRLEYYDRAAPPERRRINSMLLLGRENSIIYAAKGSRLNGCTMTAGSLGFTGKKQKEME